uniref:PDZ domain-containing protein n=1 Tax=Plectus sambesii TaxID=2011161 RepID=A0A914W2U1_9BILA
MAALYPSLEDMKVHQYQQAQVAQTTPHYPSYNVGGGGRVSETAVFDDVRGATASYPAMGVSQASDALVSAYPSLNNEYMGLKLEPPSGPVTIVSGSSSAVAVQSKGHVVQAQTAMVAPLTSQSLGLARANVTHGVREVIVCKDGKGKVGMRFRAVNKGIFVQFVAEGSPAALAGLRFGDQILQIDGENVVGLNHDKAMDLMTKCKNPGRIALGIRDRPFERTITLHKDSSGHLGFEHKDNQIVAIAKETSAARNGLLVDHHILEVNGQNVIGLKNKEVGKVLETAGQTVTLTVMPSIIYDHMVKCMDFSLIKKKQDHSIPEV